MPAMRIERSIEIDAPVDAVYAKVRDFKAWTEWSPWLISEPDCPLTYREDGNGYSWDGKIIGSGEIEVTNDDPPNAIEHRLTFFKPFKSTSQVRFKLESAGSGTKATWTMDGSLPFFMFFLKKMMETFVGMDYDRGLKMLKDVVEKGESMSKVEFPGIRSIEAINFLGIRTSCGLDEIGPTMAEGMKKLGDFLSEKGLKPSGHPVSAYHKWAPTKNLVEYTVGFPLADIPADLPDGFVSASLPACRAYEVRHTGAYRHLGNAWSAGMGHGRAKLFAQNKKMTPFEFYENQPGEVDEKDLVTVVCLPVK